MNQKNKKNSFKTQSNKKIDNIKKKRKVKIKNVLMAILLFICFIILVVSTINIVKWLIESNNTHNQIDNINDNIHVSEQDDSKNTEIIPNNTPKSDPYWDYIKMKLIDVDFKELKKINDSTAGWIQVEGTNINYPFVQYTDNDFYLNHAFDKSYNSAGWVFMDYRNNIKQLDKNTIIYAHGRVDNTMFGSLRKILTSGWLKNTHNYVVKLSTERENTLWQVFSVYKIPTTNDYLDISFNDNQQFLEFANKLLQRSAHNFKTTVNNNDKILTLSTCYNNKDKVVLHAKLIKRESK